jgi:hypothetical protein
MQNMNGHLEEFKYLGKNDDPITSIINIYIKIFYILS